MPQPAFMWEQPDTAYPSLSATCTYTRPQFTVTVQHTSGAEISESFHQCYEPLFGMDVLDQQQSFETATRLADRLAAQLKLKPVSLPKS